MGRDPRTALGFLKRYDRAHGTDRQRTEVLEVIARHAGNLSRVSHELNIGRRYLYKLAHAAKLFPEIEAIRNQRRRFLTLERRPWTNPSKQQSKI
jgi:hypothetical protein